MSSESVDPIGHVETPSQNTSTTNRGMSFADEYAIAKAERGAASMTIPCADCQEPVAPPSTRCQSCQEINEAKKNEEDAS